MYKIMCVFTYTYVMKCVCNLTSAIHCNDYGRKWGVIPTDATIVVGMGGPIRP
jgi:hypothetical protein